jgi:23S rRNA (uracil1939-C5)-methyltransferase
VPDQIEIDDLAPGGEGVARIGGRPVFVPFAAPGDRIEVEIPPGEDAAHPGPGRLLRAGPDRIDPPCPHFGPGPEADRLCGGCEWLHLRYDRQLREKERGLVEALRRIGRLEPGSYPLLPILPSPEPLRYRSRAKFHVDRDGERLVFFRRRSHQPVQLRTCHLLEPGLDRLREEFGPALARARLRPGEVALEWSVHAGRGSALLRGIDMGEGTRRRCQELLDATPSLSGLVLEGDGDGRRGRLVAVVGDPVLLHERVPGDPAAGLARSRPDIFQQANRGANARLVEAALAMLRPEGEDVLELFCGSGNFTAPLAVRAASVAAVEGQGPALELARAELSGRNVRFFAGDALAIAGALGREGRRFGALLLDPPRDGMKGLGPLLRDLRTPRAVYVSCDAATMARDVRGAVAAGYRVASVQPVDMFPQTHHVEAVVLLEPA